ncbi:hypothetical protein ACIRVF_06030 [Kitasatospora sp. NPDC101157]|uniref:hypothetical protein n=1 Tax=Kitasatospora sp. NPDC101157 TaxID=3364098 RepID=UPI00381BB017
MHRILDAGYVPGRRRRTPERRPKPREGHHAASVLLIRDQPEPLLLVHVRRPQQPAVSVATHLARTRAGAAGPERREPEGT